ncbi:MAG TPA: DUF4199 domain-containing protein [Mucilaginibacter sp.]|nr:DUF4199 domain-containing protein [Mucilaginibacter sp.]
MKNAILPGLIIGILSGIWLFIMLKMGITFTNNTAHPIEIVSVFIPIIGLYFGVKSYMYGEMHGRISFFEALLHSFKILIVAGIFVVFIGIVYLNYIDTKSTNWGDFSERIFAALIIGVLSSLAVSLLLMTKGNTVEEQE